MGLTIKDINIGALSPMVQYLFCRETKKSRKHEGLKGFFI